MRASDEDRERGDELRAENVSLEWDRLLLLDDIQCNIINFYALIFVYGLNSP
jgi:hypothetical protein